jgi:pimeloyl-ACP methyl ester carboxylesterase
VRCPVLALQGEDDEFFSAAQLEALARLLPGRLETLRISGCAHYPLHQARHEVLAAAIRFIRAALAAPASPGCLSTPVPKLSG